MPKSVPNRVFFSAILSAFFFFNINASFAGMVDDGFGSSRKIEGEHFTVYYSGQLDPDNLAQELNINPTNRILTGNSLQTRDFSLAGMLDTLFTEVCDILDMQLYSYHGTIKICRDQSHLTDIYRQLFDKELGNAQSFYSIDLNTIYISAANFRRAVIGHEIGHAVISHYFAVQPSIKIQEVLAGYVEYQLRKYSG